MGKDHMGYHRGWIQFQSNKIAEITLFMKMKYALSNDKPALETIKRSYPDATDAATFNLYEFHYRWIEMQSLLLQYVISVTQRYFPYRLQELIYTASVITEARLIFSSFHYTFLSCSQIGWVEICQENHEMFSLQTPVQSTGWQLGRRHLNCLIMDLGYDSLSHPERNGRWVVWAKAQLLYHLELRCVYLCVHSDWVQLYTCVCTCLTRPSLKHHPQLAVV